MYRVLLVDDEKWIVENLKSSIDWAGLGFTVCGAASNGNEALALIERHDPHLVISDVRMPEISGLDLIKQTSASHPRTVFIFISGYAEFTYAQKAMKYGAVGYCIKPLDEDELTGLIIKSKQLLDSGIAQKTNKTGDLDIFPLIYERSEENAARIREIINENGIEWTVRTPVAAVTLTGSAYPFVPPSALPVRTGGLKIAFIMDRRSLNEYIKEPDLFTDGEITGAGISSPVPPDGDLSAAVRQSEIAAYEFFITGNRKIVFFDDLNLKGIFQPAAQFEDSLRQKDIRRAFDLLRDMEEGFKQGLYHIHDALKLYNIAAVLPGPSVQADETGYLADFSRLAVSARDINTMFLETHARLEAYFQRNAAVDLDTVQNKNFRELLAYLHLNFYRDITFQDVSAMFAITPNYLSQLFRKETGETYTNYITRLRMRYAGDLLTGTSLTVTKIAETCGYNEYYYFCKVFKKWFGVIPSEYRNAEKPSAAPRRT
jgi:two-component system response regulator YesN